MKKIIKILTLSSLLVFAFSFTFVSSENVQKDLSKDYLNKLDSIVTKLEILQTKCIALLELNKSYSKGEIIPNFDLLMLANQNWSKLEDIYKNDLTNALNSSELVGEVQANINRFEEIKERAESAYNVWLYRDITLMLLKSKNKQNNPEDIINNLILYYYSRDCNSVEFLALLESIKEYDIEKAIKLIDVLQNQYLRTVSFVRIGLLEEAFYDSGFIQDKNDLLNSLILILNSNPDCCVIDEIINKLMILIDSSQFLNHIYSFEKIVNSVAPYSIEKSKAIIAKIPDDFPEIKLACLLNLMEIQNSFKLDEKEIIVLLSKIESRFPKESLTAKYLILKAKNDEKIKSLPLTLATTTFRDRVYLAILNNNLSKNPNECFTKASELINDPSMKLKVHLAAIKKIAMENKKAATKLIEILYADLAKVPDKSVLADIIRFQADLEPDKASDKIIDIENPALRAQIYAELSAKFYKDNIYLSEVLFRKAQSTMKEIPDMELTERIKLISDIAHARRISNKEEAKQILDSSLDFINKY
ncbi:MAG: hypothetical protein HW421_4101 [Ignavibacteria bacterium]|nr:hypothetical protein [Ignavibacteria bacterium]